MQRKPHWSLGTSSARGEAARRERQRQAAERDHFKLGHDLALGLHRRAQFRDQRMALFDAGYPAAQAIAHQQGKRMVVVDIERGTGDERHLAFAAQLHRREIIGFDHEAAFLDQPLERTQFRFGFDQRERGQHDLLAAGGQLLREIDPVARAQFAALAAHRFAEIKDVERPAHGLAIERKRALAWPEVLQGAETEFHRVALNANVGGRGRAWSGGLRHDAKVPVASPAARSTCQAPRYVDRSPRARCA